MSEVHVREKFLANGDMVLERVEAPPRSEGRISPEREAWLRAKPAHYHVHELWPELDALRKELAEAKAENATMHQRVAEWMEDDAEMAVRLVAVEKELTEARKDRDDANERALADNAEAVRARAERDEARAQLTEWEATRCQATHEGESDWLEVHQLDMEQAGVELSRNHAWTIKQQLKHMQAQITDEAQCRHVEGLLSGLGASEIHFGRDVFVCARGDLGVGNVELYVDTLWAAIERLREGGNEN